MYDLLKKLNTLVSAQVNELASHLPSLERKPDLDRQVAGLRQRVAAALEHEDKLRAQVGALQTEIAGLDSRIDGAIQAGQEATARALLEEVQRLQKRLAWAESDLRQHQQSAADLIVRVNELEAAVGDLKSSQVTTSTPAATSTDSVMDHKPPTRWKRSLARASSMTTTTTRCRWAPRPTISRAAPVSPMKSSLPATANTPLRWSRPGKPGWRARR